MWALVEPINEASGLSPPLPLSWRALAGAGLLPSRGAISFDRAWLRGWTAKAKLHLLVQSLEEKPREDLDPTRFKSALTA